MSGQVKDTKKDTDVKKVRARTYARNRTQLSRRGFEKNAESDGVFILKLVAVILIGSFWLKFEVPFDFLGMYMTAIPVGLILGLALVRVFEKRPFNKKIWYVVVLITAIVSYFLPSGIVI